ncbi:TPA: hypothetical protein DCX16_00245 [bacterium]|nr:hypothetical protein [bacterium]
MSTQVKGTEFEKKVARLFNLMGYKTEIKKMLNDTEIDIYGEANLGPSKIKMIAECKNYTAKNVQLDEMKIFNGVVSSFSRKEIQQAYVITTEGFAPQAKAFAEENGIECFTYSELLNKLINFDHYLDWIIENYENDEISKYYVDLDAEKREKQKVEVYKPIDKYINEWLSKKEKNHISILGEYGTGKTSFCKKYAYDLALRYKEDPTNNRIPILINLRDYAKAMNIKQLITDLLVNQHNLRNATFSTFSKMNEEGLFLLIFDGFDEMAQKVDVNITMANFNELSKTAIFEKSKVILTCRTEYFRTKEKEREVLEKGEGYVDISDKPNFEILHLKDFTDKKIKKFLQKRIPEEWESYYAQINNTYNLMELAHRPVLLDIIAESLPQLVARREEINAAKLYEVYTNFWLERDIMNERTFIKKEDRTFFMQELAFQMLVDEKLSIHYSQMAESIKKHFKLEKAEEIDYFSHDIMTCSFMNRDEGGNYSFAHKSSMEFFVAKKLAQEFNQNKQTSFKQKEITTEISDFVVNLLAWDEDCIKRLEKWLLEEEDSNLLTNLMRIMNEAPKLNSQAKKCLESLFTEENERLRRLSTEKCPQSIEGMVYIPETEFIMGSYEYDAERPVRKVKVNTFYIDRYPVTNAQYKEFVDATKHQAPEYWEGGKIPTGKEDHPVVCVSWHDARAYCEWKSKVTGVKVRLPKEEEWELAGRGILGRRWPWGNEFDHKKCNTNESRVGDTTSVRRYEEGKSPYGCYDMAGNVWEWCHDWYKVSPGKNPQGPDDRISRVLRGGSWYGYANGCRVANRYGDVPEDTGYNVGFRCCQDFLK